MTSTEIKIDRMIQYIQDKDLNIQLGETLDEKTAFIANWNDFDKISTWLVNLEMYDHASIELLWSDTYMQCGDCYKYFDGSPAHYGDQGNGLWVSDCDYLCQSCATEAIDDVIEHYQNDTNIAIPGFMIDSIKDQGFVCMDDADLETCKIFESGYHPGQNDSPVSIIEDLDKEGITDKFDYIFGITSTGQFDINFALFLREKEL